jgi:glycosyltransferase involved in cell wall biosynthesis
MTRWVVAAGDFTPLGGMDRANYALAQHLAAAGREVHLVAHRVWPPLAAMPGVVVHRVPRPFGSHLLGAPLLSHAASTIAAPLGPAARLLANGGNTRWHAPTWIHYVHAAHAPQVAAGLRARATTLTGRQMFLARERDALTRASTIICNSRRTAADLERCYGIHPDRVRVVYYGTDADTFGAVTSAERTAAQHALGLDPSRRAALFVGALGDRRKGFDLLLEAWRRVSAAHDWHVDLVVVGAGAEVDRWQRRVSDAGLSTRVHFLGFRPDIARVIAACDLLVHPARYEAYGLGVHEALSRGLPVIVSSSAGVTERIPADFGPLLLPDPPTVHDLVARLGVWHTDAAQWRARAAAAGAALRRRSWDDMARDIVQIVEHA